MKKPIYTVSNYRKTVGRFERLYKKITAMMTEGSFWDMKLFERNALLRKLKYLLKRLDQFKLKTGVKIAGATLAFTILANSAFSQPFEEKTGLNNPFVNTENPFIGLLKGEPDFVNVKIPTLADIDGDGDLDLISANGKGNSGPKNKSYTRPDIKYNGIIPKQNAKGPWDFEIGLFENTGTAEEPVYEEVSGTNNPFNGLEFPYMRFSQANLTDIDGDGDLDLSVCALTSDYNYYTFQFFENNGTVQNASFTERTGTDNPLNITFYEMFNHEFADIDNDGDSDLIVSISGSILLYENIGDSDNPVFSYTCSNPFNGIFLDARIETELIDIDDDGDLDLFLLGEPYGPYKIDFISFYENMGSAESASFVETACPFDGLSGSAAWAYSEFADIDNDGDFDALFDYITFNSYFYQADPLHYFKNDGTASAPDFKEVMNMSVSYVSRTDFADIDDDGDLDMALGGAYSELFFIENIGTVETPQFILINDSSSPFYDLPYLGGEVSPEFVDLDNDGDFDLVVSSNYLKSGLQYYENTGDAGNPIFTLITSYSPVSGIYSVGYNGGEAHFADIDGDGDKDLFTQSGDNLLLFYRNIGDSENPSFSLDYCGNPFGSITINGLISMDFIDFDIDGDIDMVKGYYDNIFEQYAVGYYDNAGNSSNPLFDDQIGSNNPFNTVNESSFVWAFPRCADLDNDGDNDLLLGDLYGDLRYFENLFINSGVEKGVKSYLSIYPNPSDAQFFIQMNDIQSIGVWNLNGQMLFNKNVNTDNYMLDLSEYTKGLYFVKVISSEGEFNHKVILK